MSRAYCLDIYRIRTSAGMFCGLVAQLTKELTAQCQAQRVARQRCAAKTRAMSMERDRTIAEQRFVDPSRGQCSRCQGDDPSRRLVGLDSAIRHLGALDELLEVEARTCAQLEVQIEQLSRSSSRFAQQCEACYLDLLAIRDVAGHPPVGGTVIHTPSLVAYSIDPLPGGDDYLLVRCREGLDTLSLSWRDSRGAAVLAIGRGCLQIAELVSMALRLLSRRIAEINGQVARLG